MNLRKIKQRLRKVIHLVSGETIGKADFSY
jgi:hypothetical protein